MVVIGVVVATIQINLFSDNARRLRDEGERLAALLTALADESVTSGQPLAVSFSENGYTFWERNPEATALQATAPQSAQNASPRWRERPNDELFSSRTLQGEIRIAEVRIRQRPLSLSNSRADENLARIAFSPSGIHPPFSVLLGLDDLRVQVIADAVGNLRVVDDLDEGLF